MEWSVCCEGKGKGKGKGKCKVKVKDTTDYIFFMVIIKLHIRLCIRLIKDQIGYGFNQIKQDLITFITLHVITWKVLEVMWCWF